MKLTSLLALATLLIAPNAIATQLSPIANVNYSVNNAVALTVQNLSSEYITIDIYGDEFALSPSSGIAYNCKGYAYVELQFKGTIHDFFEVPCSGLVSISEDFQLVQE